MVCKIDSLITISHSCLHPIGRLEIPQLQKLDAKLTTPGPLGSAKRGHGDDPVGKSIS